MVNRPVFTSSAPAEHSEVGDPMGSADTDMLTGPPGSESEVARAATRAVSSAGTVMRAPVSGLTDPSGSPAPSRSNAGGVG
jgi:hypothetical protein